MKLLVAAVHKDLPRVPGLGRLVIPRLTTDVDLSVRSGMTWAADCDAFLGWGPLQAERYERMLERIERLPGCEWVTVPDVVGDHEATLEMFQQWAPLVELTGLPLAFVLQNGVTPETVPWDRCRAVFIGGDDVFKLGLDVPALVAEAHRRGCWVHMGRVNSFRRMRYAASLGCDSVDGTKFARWRDAHLTNGLRWLQAANDQMRLPLEATS